MSAFVPKQYQQAVLDSVSKYLAACNALENADKAFYNTTLDLWGQGSSFRSIDGFDPDMPYFCLRVPTGGGKTWLAAKSVAIVNEELLQESHSVILWLTPSNAIREQTLRALKDRSHPYHAALRDAGPLTVLDLDEAKSVTRATLETSTTVIVCTRQAFQVGNTDIRKVYESDGALMSHFEGLTSEQRDELLQDDDGVVPRSLANVLRLRRPFVIVDEAHNSRTELAFDTLARFRPSGIMELTATPDTTKTPSNVLHSVWAAELKAEEMIKLPILLETESNWRQCLANALYRREQLQQAARAEQRGGAPYLRPVVLIQAEPRSRNRDSRHVEHVRKELIDNQNVPAEEIVIATGEEKGLEKIAADYREGIADERCPVKYVITQRALAEGWDCPSAYVLVSMAEVHSATAVEQLLGRILRQPDAKRRDTTALNQSYAFVVSTSFRDTAHSLRESLVKGAGFERHEAAEFVSATRPEQHRMDFERIVQRGTFQPIVVELPKKPTARVLKQYADKISWDTDKRVLVVGSPLDEAEEKTIASSLKDEPARKQIAQAAELSRKQAEQGHFETPAELGLPFQVPQMGLRVQGELALFDDPEVLDYPWELSGYEATPTSEQLKRLHGAEIGEGGALDTDEESGTVTVNFMRELQRDLDLSAPPENWNEVKLAAWLCRNLRDITATHESKRAFVAAWLQELLRKDFDLARLNRDKFLLRGLLDNRIRELRNQAINRAYQDTLFGDHKNEHVTVGANGMAFDFPQYGYAPNRTYDGHFGPGNFRHHYYGTVGAFDSREEYECAWQLDDLAEKGKIEFWVRNLARKPACSFFLQKATDKFWPDFMCKLPNGVVLAVEYKGADRWASAEDDRLIGGLWEELSGGRCRFVMIKDKNWDGIAKTLS
ncbi:MAG: DEAD/DEAH box helicase family protein [Gammaproteobacteria bacterium]|nr:DEAD/DEAH box helicase family protein [Gammaproteobacteria bacterium]